MQKILTVVMALCLSACVPLPLPPTNAELAKDQQEAQVLADKASVSETTKRASIDLNCPAQEIKVSNISGRSVMNINYGASNGSWLAEGCGKRNIYQLMCVCKADFWIGSCSDQEGAVSCNPILESNQTAVDAMNNNAATAHKAAAQQQMQMQQMQPYGGR